MYICALISTIDQHCLYLQFMNAVVFLCSLPSLCVFLGPCHYAMHHDASSATGAKHASFPIFSVFLVDYRKINPINPSRNAGKYKVSK